VPFPPGDGRTGKSTVSSASGRQPRWRANGTDPAFQAATPHALFQSPTIAHATNTQQRYDVTRDRKKFLMANGLVREPSSPETGLKK
jgi:hypothetical protein